MIKTSTSSFILIAVLLCLLFSCKKEQGEIQWYYWKQDFKLGNEQEELLDSLNTQTIYTKYFDVDIEDGAIKPLALIQFQSSPKNLEIIPCVYITNRTFLNNKANDPTSLAQKVFDLVREINDKNRINPYNEIQFDCDWTSKTKQNYFDFLEAFKTLARENVVVTSTLRLHQLKYPKETGVPPVEKVCLMVYNVGDIKDPKETNSIFKPSIVEDYIQASSTYPLPMDIALPAYSWAVLYRFNKLSLIFSNMNASSLDANNNLEKIDDFIYQSKLNHYFEGNYLYKDDLIRLEEIHMDSLQAVLPLFKGVKSAETKLILFELSNENSLNYTYEEFESIANNFY